MKTLTVKQPWASLIIEGIKDIENRTWKTKFRGTVLIHSSAKSVGCDIQKILTQEQYNSLPFPKITHEKICDESYPFSSIIGSVEIIDCVINHESIWAEKTPIDPHTGEIHLPPIYNWVLSNPIKFERPIENVKGKLSFWEFDEKF